MKKTTSLKIAPEIWKEAKKRSIDKDISISSYIETLIKKDLKIFILFLILIVGGTL